MDGSTGAINGAGIASLIQQYNWTASGVAHDLVNEQIKAINNGITGAKVEAAIGATAGLIGVAAGGVGEAATVPIGTAAGGADGFLVGYLGTVASDAGGALINWWTASDSSDTVQAANNNSDSGQGQNAKPSFSGNASNMDMVDMPSGTLITPIPNSNDLIIPIPGLPVPDPSQLPPLHTGNTDGTTPDTGYQEGFTPWVPSLGDIIVTSTNNDQIPQYVYDRNDWIENNFNNVTDKGSGYKGGQTYNNDGRGGSPILPTQDINGNPITYREWDVHNSIPGKSRGPERIITGSDGSSYYTNDHYHTFYKMRDLNPKGVK